MRIMDEARLQLELKEWKNKSWSIPELQGGKHVWYELIKRLVNLLGNNSIVNLSEKPELDGLVEACDWKSYLYFLNGIGLVENIDGIYKLSKAGQAFWQDPDTRKLADLIQNKYRLFGEVLELIYQRPVTIQELDRELCELYQLDWKNISNTRKRINWLEVLGLVQALGQKKWGITDAGKEALKEWYIIDSEVLKENEAFMTELQIKTPPKEIELLLQELQKSPELHKKRCTYNIFVPSPNRIENLEKIIQFSLERVSKQKLFAYLENEFNLKSSSARSMLPFLNAAGLLEETEREVYKATPEATAWVKNGDKLDFVRILHAKMKFVGEMLLFTEKKTSRGEVYKKANQYGLNDEKAKWIARFLIEASLLEEPQYLQLRTSNLGKEFVKTLPLDILNEEKKKVMQEKKSSTPEIQEKLDIICENLHETSIKPSLEGKILGKAFEEALVRLFRYMGFKTTHIGGSGNTDLVLQWKNEKGKKYTAIVEAKSKASGPVSHNDISEVALEMHKEKNQADYVVVVGPGFAGDTIKEFARKKGYVLLTDKQLIKIAQDSENIGLTLQEIAIAFATPDGIVNLEKIVKERCEEMNIISTILQQFRDKQEVLGSLSPRDVFWQLDGKIALEKLIKGFETLASEQIKVLQKIEETQQSKELEGNRYCLYDEKKAVNRMRALANAIEKGEKQ